jgi:hypothetical protein
MKEVWKDIEGYEGRYLISNQGRVKSLGFFSNPLGFSIWVKRIKFLNLHIDRYGYVYVSLSKNKHRRSFKVHRLVAQAFILNSENKPQINHRDGNKQNNCVDNLEWVTQSENNWHAFNVLDSTERRLSLQSQKKGKWLGTNNPKWKGAVLCLTSGAIFESVSEVVRVIGVSRYLLNKVLNKNKKDVKGLNFEYYRGEEFKI